VSLAITLDRIRAIVAAGEVRVSRHAVQELAADAILLDDILAGIADAVLVEDYPAAFKGPTALVLQRDRAATRSMWYGAWRRVRRDRPFW